MPELKAIAYIVAAVGGLCLMGGCKGDSGGTETTVTKSRHYYQVRSIETFADSDRVILGSNTGIEFATLDTATGALVSDANYSTQTQPALAGDVIRSVTRSDDGSYLVVGTNDGISICTLENERLKVCNDYNDTSIPALPNNNAKDLLLIGNTLIVGTYHGGVALGHVDPQTATVASFEIFDVHSLPKLKSPNITSLAINTSKDIVIVGTAGEGIALAHYDALSKTIDAIEHISEPTILSDSVQDVAIAPSGNRVAIATLGGLNIARLENNNTLSVIGSYTRENFIFRQFKRVAFSHDGGRIAAGTFRFGLMVADLDAQGVLQNYRYLSTYTVPMPSDYIYALGFNRDGTRLFVGGGASDTNPVTVIRID